MSQRMIYLVMEEKRTREGIDTKVLCVDNFIQRFYPYQKKRLNFQSWSCTVNVTVHFPVRCICLTTEERTKLSFPDGCDRMICAGLSANMLMIFNLFRKILSYCSAKRDTTKKKGHKNNFNNVCERRRLHFPFHFTVYECDKHTNVDLYV